MEPIQEELAGAIKQIQVVVFHIQGALGSAKNVDGLLFLSMLSDARKLELRLKEALKAWVADNLPAHFATKEPESRRARLARISCGQCNGL